MARCRELNDNILEEGVLLDDLHVRLGPPEFADLLQKVVTRFATSLGAACHDIITTSNGAEFNRASTDITIIMASLGYALSSVVQPVHHCQTTKYP